MGENTESPAELYPGHAAELERNKLRAAQIKQAGSNPLPGPLMEAFAHIPEEIGGLKVRPLVHYDFVIMRKIESPLLKQIGSAATATAYDDDQGYEMIFQFTRPVREVAALLARGRESFRQAAVEQIGMSLGPMEVAQLVGAVEREFLRAFSTVIKYGAPQSEDGGETFTAPPAEAMVTASAGGSITSPN